LGKTGDGKRLTRSCGQIFIRASLHSPTDIHPEDGNCSVCRNVGKPSNLDPDYLRRPKLYISFFLPATYILYTHTKIHTYVEKIVRGIVKKINSLFTKVKVLCLTVDKKFPECFSFLLRKKEIPEKKQRGKERKKK
jgi:hypothetical protein